MKKMLFTKERSIDSGEIDRYIEEVDKYIKNWRSSYHIFKSHS